MEKRKRRKKKVRTFSRKFPCSRVWQRSSGNVPSVESRRKIFVPSAHHRDECLCISSACKLSPVSIVPIVMPTHTRRLRTLQGFHFASDSPLPFNDPRGRFLLHGPPPGTPRVERTIIFEIRLPFENHDLILQTSSFSELPRRVEYRYHFVEHRGALSRLMRSI